MTEESLIKSIIADLKVSMFLNEEQITEVKRSVTLAVRAAIEITDKKWEDALRLERRTHAHNNVPIKMVDRYGRVINRFSSITEAVKNLQMDRSSIKKALKKHSFSILHKCYFEYLNK